MTDPINVVVDKIPLPQYAYNICRHNDVLYCSNGKIQRVDPATRQVTTVASSDESGAMALVDFHQPIALPPDVAGSGLPDVRIYFTMLKNRIGEVIPALFDQFATIDVLPTWFSGQVTDLIPFRMAATNKSGLLYLFDTSSMSIAVVDLSVQRMVGSIQLESWAQDIVVSPDDRFIYAAHPYDDVVSVVDTAAWPPKVTKVPVANGPSGLALSPDGKTLFIAKSGESHPPGSDLGTGALAAYDTATMQGVWVYTGKNSFSVEINSAGTHAYVTNNDGNSVSVVDVSAGLQVVATIVGTTEPTYMCLSADEKHLYVIEGGTSPAINVVAV